MIILDKPYVSDFLRRTINEQRYSVVVESGVDVDGLDPALVLDDAAAAALCLRQGEPVYTNSENAIGWIAAHLGRSDLPGQIHLFKDKVAFREMVRGLYPDFFFLAVPFAELGAVDVRKLVFPCVVKPAVGFFSMGVHRVEVPDQWPEVVRRIEAEMAESAGIYPEAVLDTAQFIIEECVEGEEYAIDAFYDDEGRPVIVDVLRHPFSSAGDVSDRVYYTSAEVVTSHWAEFEEFLAAVGRAGGFRKFPVHAEVRMDARGRVVPIEINPMRFAGWCTTDVAWHAWGINPYVQYFRQEGPRWERILKQRGHKTTALVILDKPADIPAEDIAGFDYERALAGFDRVHELRRVDWHEYPVFGFAIVETDNIGVLDAMLRVDLSPYVRRG